MCSAYLISEENHTAKEAMDRFTAARMRPGFGEGVSIPSQVRWVGYVERWTREFAKSYVERRARIREIHVWGLRTGVRVAVQGYVDEGKKIETFHTFADEEAQEVSNLDKDDLVDVIFKPKNNVVLPTNDVNIDFERRSNPRYGITIVTSIAHVWFNAFFEGGKDQDSGVFEIEWAAMDGIKGTFTKGLQILDRLSVVWSLEHEGEMVIKEPATGEPIHEPGPASPIPNDDAAMADVVDALIADRNASKASD